MTPMQLADIDVSPPRDQRVADFLAALHRTRCVADRPRDWTVPLLEQQVRLEAQVAVANLNRHPLGYALLTCRSFSSHPGDAEYLAELLLREAPELVAAFMGEEGGTL